MTAPHLPRDTWADHPRFPGQTLLLDSHEAFRNRSAWLIASVCHVAPDRNDVDARKRRRWLNRLSAEFDWWMAGMRGHERYEERKLYPYLARRWGARFDDLEAGHRELGVHRTTVERAFGRAVAAIAGDDERARYAALIRALESHRRVLLAHLQLEEERVIPLLLELLPEEFAQYVDTPAHVLLGEEKPV